MRELLSGRTREYQEKARQVAETAVRPIAAELDRTGEYPWPVIHALREAGLMGIWIPEAYGGSGSEFTDAAVVFEALGKGPVPGPMFSSGVLAAQVIQRDRHSPR